MKKKKISENEDEMRAEYDFKGGVRGKYLERYRAGTNLALLAASSVGNAARTSGANQALRFMMQKKTKQVSGK